MRKRLRDWVIGRHWKNVEVHIIKSLDSLERIKMEYTSISRNSQLGLKRAEMGQNEARLLDFCDSTGTIELSKKMER